ncbi:hypothetical protein K1719_020703 [Acacia pycnantha]|nr:hypothetical protein K1719_020703 [Acacia pycnantha]
MLVSPRYVGPFEILAKRGEVAYQIALPPDLSNLHDVFHVSQLKKYQPDRDHVIEYEDVEVRHDNTFIVERSGSSITKRNGLKQDYFDCEGGAEGFVTRRSDLGDRERHGREVPEFMARSLVRID